MPISIFWFRRDLRLEDNTALSHALKKEHQVLPIFIFDDEILKGLSELDLRITFIHDNLNQIHHTLQKKGSGVNCYLGHPVEVFKSLVDQYEIDCVYYNDDYEPYSRIRDKKVSEFLNSQNVAFKGFKDQVLFEKSEITKNDGNPYSVFTPYKKRWLEKLNREELKTVETIKYERFLKGAYHFPSLEEIGFSRSNIRVQPYRIDKLNDYGSTRNYPSLDSSTYLGPHLRFGTISIRSIVKKIQGKYPEFLDELIWREFFMQIIYHFPKVVNNNFRKKYDAIKWLNGPVEFEKWKAGETGYPLVDAGMRQLNQTGYMHNRVRMITASFLCKHLLIDWRWGEAYFAEKLLDFELSSNNGNWQWAAGTGCDAAPYFRIFNPTSQQEKFDKDYKYVRKWIPEFDTDDYPDPIIEHKFARNRAIDTYKSALYTN